MRLPVLRRSLVVNFAPERGVSAMNNAIRTNSDPWAALRGAPRPSVRELERRRRESELTGHQYDDTHPPTHLRINLVCEVPEPAPGSPEVLSTGNKSRIDDEVAALSTDMTSRLRDLAFSTWW